MKVTRLSPYCMVVEIDYKARQKASFMISADHHWDNPKCDRALLKKDLDRALSEQMGIFSFGDLFCAMQGKGDRRHSKSDILPEHNVGNYLDALTDTAADYYAKYGKNILAISDGNHETSVLKHKEVDLSTRLCEGIYHKTGHRPEKMPYAGWIFFRFKYKGTTVKTVKLAYTHGHGGGGIVTKGTLWPTRRAAQLPDADIFVSGHIHEKWIFPVAQERINDNGIANIKEQIHVQIPTYKEEYLSGNGFHREKGGPPKPLGCWFLHFTMGNFRHPINKTYNRGVQIDFESSTKTIIH